MNSNIYKNWQNLLKTDMHILKYTFDARSEYCGWIITLTRFSVIQRELLFVHVICSSHATACVILKTTQNETKRNVRTTTTVGRRGGGDGRLPTAKQRQSVVCQSFARQRYTSRVKQRFPTIYERDRMIFNQTIRDPLKKM